MDQSTIVVYQGWEWAWLVNPELVSVGHQHQRI